MPDDQRQSYRLKLGPVVTDLLEQLSEQTAAALDDRVDRLLATEHRVAGLENERQLFRDQVATLGGNVTSMATALTTTSASVDKVTDLIDHRTREIQKLMLHISTLVGTTMTEGAERDRLHVRFNEIFTDLGKQMDALSTLVKDQQQARQRTVQNVVGRAEEERLAIAEQNTKTELARPDKTRGLER
jgi:chromosome segregation ATPase